MELTSTVHGQVGAHVRWATQDWKLFTSNWAKGSRTGAESADDSGLRLATVAYCKRYSKVLKYEYRIKTAVLDTLKRYSILSLTLYLE
jgi:hypothetical protein